MASAPELSDLFAQIEYHLGWLDATLTPLAPGKMHSGKLLRPTLTLYSCELAALASGACVGEGSSERLALVDLAMPAAVAVELVHNFSLIHDDIEDGDEERHHYPTLWKLWGQPQAINTGDALFALARAQIWGLTDRGAPPALVVHAGRILDRACLDICEGQHLDMSFEDRQDVTVAHYFAMIDRKTAALMRCAAELGGRLGAPDASEVGDRLAAFGRALGLAFQLRDDLLGIWAAGELGKTEAGDVRRKKKSLPIIHALEHAQGDDRAALAEIYATREPANEQQIARTLLALEHTGARQRAYEALNEQVAVAHEALAAVAVAAGEPERARTSDAYAALAAALAFVAG